MSPMVRLFTHNRYLNMWSFVFHFHLVHFLCLQGVVLWNLPYHSHVLMFLPYREHHNRLFGVVSAAVTRRNPFPHNFNQEGVPGAE